MMKGKAKMSGIKLKPCPLSAGRSYANKYYSARHRLQIGNVHEVQGKG